MTACSGNVDTGSITENQGGADAMNSSSVGGAVEEGGEGGGYVIGDETYTIEILIDESNCNQNTGKAGEPELCLEVKYDNNPPRLEARACKGPDKGPFQNSHQNTLSASSGESFSPYIAGGIGYTCDEWHTFDVKKLPCESIDLSMKVLSPSDCAVSECNYQTGYVTVNCNSN